MKKIIIGIYILLITGCSANRHDFDDWSKYEDEEFDFSVEYPSYWEGVPEETWVASEEREASPDGGINIYINGNEDDYIYILGQKGHWSKPNENGYVEKSFSTIDGEKGIIYEQSDESEYIGYLVLEEGFHGAVMRMSKEIYEENQDTINKVLTTIKIK